MLLSLLVDTSGEGGGQVILSLLVDTSGEGGGR